MNHFVQGLRAANKAKDVGRVQQALMNLPDPASRNNWPKFVPLGRDPDPAYFPNQGKPWE